MYKHVKWGQIFKALDATSIIHREPSSKKISLWIFLIILNMIVKFSKSSNLYIYLLRQIYLLRFLEVHSFG